MAEHSSADSAVEDTSVTVRIAGMDCGNCAATIEDSIAQLPGVEGVSVSFTTETMDLRGDVELERVSRIHALPVGSCAVSYGGRRSRSLDSFFFYGNEAA